MYLVIYLLIFKFTTLFFIYIMMIEYTRIGKDWLTRSRFLIPNCQQKCDYILLMPIFAGG